MQIHFCIGVKVVDENTQDPLSIRVQMRDPFFPAKLFLKQKGYNILTVKYEPLKLKRQN